MPAASKIEPSSPRLGARRSVAVARDFVLLLGAAVSIGLMIGVGTLLTALLLG